jgi:hypothetical protein
MIRNAVINCGSAAGVTALWGVDPFLRALEVDLTRPSRANFVSRVFGCIIYSGKAGKSVSICECLSHEDLVYGSGIAEHIATITHPSPCTFVRLKNLEMQILGKTGWRGISYR